MQRSTTSKRFFLLSLALIGLLFFFRCVPIEDLQDPRIIGFELQTEYNISDTLRVEAIVLDNFGVQTVRIDVESLDNPLIGWTVSQNLDSIGARRLELKRLVRIPPNIELGEYELTLTIVDVSGREIFETRTFIINGDNSTPSFVDVILPQLELIGDNLYIGCRSDILFLEGYASDNVGLKELRAQFGEFPPIVRALTGQDSVDLASAFGRSIVVPSSIQNGTTVPLKLQAVDLEGNISNAFEINILIDCDDTPPLVSNLITEPAVSSGQIDVIQGEELVVIDAELSDDEALDSVFVYFVNGNQEQLLFEAALNEEPSLLLSEVGFESTLVPIPSTTRVGDTYQLVIITTDIGGNESSPLIVDIETIRNASPQILVANTYIDNQEVNVTPSTPTQIAVGSVFRIEGKLEEDVKLEYYRITWGVQGQEETVLDLDEQDLEGQLPFNLANSIAINQFQISTSARPGTRYILTLYVKDTLNDEVRLQYIFIVE